ncbi:MAG: hypothetical protein LAT68_02665 [Cyclobacteriaceae bacterium]|nr:hypothetical protein [Cyclobacteriaceae bacterium]MCH8515207.1 hypothetical protein [Cyclobacteriaceae bacterium]
MVVEEVYNYQPLDYDINGRHKEQKTSFISTIYDWEKDFNNKNPYVYANELIANYRTMLIMERALGLEEHQKCGVDLIEGTADYEAHLEMDKYNKTQTVMALATKVKESSEEAIWLYRDENLADGLVIIKHSSSNDDGNEGEGDPVPALPIDPETNIWREK